MTGRSRVFGWTSPWSGDENYPIPLSYCFWFELYRRTRVARHWLGLHDWQVSHPQDEHGVVTRHTRCTWCGKAKR